MNIFKERRRRKTNRSKPRGRNYQRRLVIEPLEERRMLAGTMLDSTFDSDGIAYVDFDSQSDVGQAVAIQGDGNIVVAGYSGGSISVARLNINGGLDASFDGDGKALTTTGTAAGGYDVAIQPDGKILVAGFAVFDTVDFAVVRYNTDGSVDTSFGTNGFVITDFTPNSSSPSYDSAWGIVVQDDGKIVLAGEVHVSGAKSTIGLARFNSNGTPDTSFGTNGRVQTSFALYQARAFDIAIDGSKIVVAGDIYGRSGGFAQEFALVRYNLDGSLDSTFSSDGMATVVFGGDAKAYGITVQTDGKIVVVGNVNGSTASTHNGLALARLNSDGSLDNGFGSGGLLTTDVGVGRDLAVQNDGKIVAIGYSSDGPVVVKYNSDGSLDSDSYGTNLASNGARHLLGDGTLYLGATKDFEADGQPTASANGDDVNGAPDDEDGVTFGPIRANRTGTVTVVSSGTGLLNAFVDFNGDGDFIDTGEQIFTNQVVSAGTNNLVFNVPATSALGATFARFRVSSDSGLGPAGPASDGEVEDYQVTIESGLDFGGAPAFQGLSQTPGSTSSLAFDVSDDGSVVVGFGDSEGFRWTVGDGIAGIGDLPGGGFFSHAYGVSGDGSVVVGRSRSADNSPSGIEAFFSTNGGPLQPLGDLPGGIFLSQANAVSADGSAIVGAGNSVSNAGFSNEAFRWTESGGMVALGDLGGTGDLFSQAHDVSADGSVVVGQSRSGSTRVAFGWTEAQGMVSLGTLPSDFPLSNALAVSADGTVVVGESRLGFQNNAFRWTTTEGMTAIGGLPDGGMFRIANDVSADGLIIVGDGTLASGISGAVIWDEENGARFVADVLVDDFGLDLTGWTLTQATAVNADGTVIVGVGFNPSGQHEAWRAVIPRAAIHGVKFHDLNGNGVRDTNLIQGDEPDVVFVVDVSASTSDLFAGGAVGDVNGDGDADTILDGELAGFLALNQELIDQGFGTSAQVAIVVFGTNGVQLDMNPLAAGIQLSTIPTADVNGNGVPDVEEVLRLIQEGNSGAGGSSTNFESALQTTINTMTTLGTLVGDGNVIFLSDGESNAGGAYTDEANTLRATGVNLRAFGVGNTAPLPALQDIDSNAEIFTTTDELLDVFSGLSSALVQYVEPGLAGWTIYLDENNNGQLDGNEPETVTNADGEYSFINLATGTYTVAEVQQRGWNPTFPVEDAQLDQRQLNGADQFQAVHSTRPVWQTFTVGKAGFLEDSFVDNCLLVEGKAVEEVLAIHKALAQLHETARHPAGVDHQLQSSQVERRSIEIDLTRSQFEVSQGRSQR